MKAAYVFAKKRKFGPFRIAPTDENRLRKELSTFARAGFSLDIARKVLGKETIEDYEAD